MKISNEVFVRRSDGSAFRYPSDFEGDYRWLSLDGLKASLDKIMNCGSWGMEHVYRARCLDAMIAKREREERQELRQKMDDALTSRSEKVRDAMYQNIRFMHDMRGDRGLTEGEYSGLRRTLRTMVEGEDSAYIKFLNELIFCVRFGYLSKSKDDSVRTVSDGITLGLSIYRRGNWHSPLSKEILEALLNRKDIEDEY